MYSPMEIRFAEDMTSIGKKITFGRKYETRLKILLCP